MKTYDEERKRATFGMAYPMEDVIFVREDKYTNFSSVTSKISQTDLKAFVKNKRLSFNLNFATLSDIIFEECNFHNMQGKEMAKINKISFENCVFKKSIMGTTEYFRVIFKKCMFERCDFMNADVKECIFEDCEFTECTAYHMHFIDTEINPTTFIKSIIVPKYNFDSINTNEKILIEREWVRVRLYLASQLFKSNNSLNNSFYSDKALLELKKAELILQKDIIDYGKDESSSIAISTIQKLTALKTWVNYFTKLLIVKLTDGGTSLFKLLYMASIITVLCSFLICFTNISYQNDKFKVTYIAIGDLIGEAINNIPLVLSLFLGFGFSSFNTTSSIEYWGLAAITIFGLFWYALIIPVVIRKIYR